MTRIRNIFSFIIEYFMLFIGLVFIFAMGVVYAVLRPQGVLVSILFLIIGFGWTLYMIKYFWDLIDKRQQG